MKKGVAISRNSLLTESSSADGEIKIHIVSQLIAYALQVFYPRGRFIFLRSLLTILNEQRAITLPSLILTPDYR